MSVGLKRVKEGRTVQTQPEGAHRSFQKASLLPSWLCFQELVFYVLAPSVVVHLCHSFALKLKKKKTKHQNKSILICLQKSSFFKIISSLEISKWQLNTRTIVWTNRVGQA